MTAAAYKQVIAAAPRDRLDLFLATANRLGAPVGNVEKDFWVCWTLNSSIMSVPQEAHASSSRAARRFRKLTA